MQAIRNYHETTPAPAASATAGPDIQVLAGLNLPGFVMSFSRNEEVFGEEEPADFVYRVISGAVRTTRLLSDGRRQVAAFHLPGDVFGLELGETHRFFAEAVADSEIALIRRSAVERLAERDGAAARHLWRLAARELEQLQDHMILLGRKSALERVAAFLLEMAERAPSGDGLDLPMSRTDIADYLGLTIETVSRTLTQLERDRMIALPTTRHIVLRNAAGLAALDS